MEGFGISFKNAFNGIHHAFKREANFQVEILVAILMVVLMVVFPLTLKEIVLLVVMIGWVLTMELLNTATERIVDMLKPQVHPYAKIAKDLMAAAVLVSSITAVIVGIIIFFPHVLDLIS